MSTFTTTNFAAIKAAIMYSYTATIAYSFTETIIATNKTADFSAIKAAICPTNNETFNTTLETAKSSTI